MSIAIGTRIGPYEITGWLGAGGTGDVYRARDSRLGRDVAIKVIAAAFAADHPSILPDGRWLAYVSNESGRYEVYVRSFPDPGVLRQVSHKGGLQPQWQRDGGALFYLAPDKTLMAVGVDPAGASFDPDAPKPLFATRTLWLEIQPTARTYAAARDGQRFLLANATQQAQSEPIRVVLNWAAALRK